MSSPPLNKSCNRAGLFKRPVRSSASSRWPQALVQNRKQLRVRSFVLAGWPSCCGPRQPAANELGGGPVRHVRPTELERLAGPSAPCSATPHLVYNFTPRTSRRAERRGCTRPPPRTWLARPSGAVILLITGAISLLGYTFRHFGGLTEQVLCDNASPLKISHDRQSGQVVWNPGFETFCRDRGLTAKACRPRRARTKGKIERGVGYVKHNALAGRSFASFEDLQRHLARWMVGVADERIHGTTKEKPSVRFERDERQALRPLQARPLAVRTRRLTRRVSADCFVDIDTIRYSAPHWHVRETVEVVVQEEQVEIWLRGRCIAQHVRCYEPHTWVRNPAHFEGLFRREERTPAPTSSEAPANSVSRPLRIYAELVEGGRPWAP